MCRAMYSREVSKVVCREGSRMRMVEVRMVEVGVEVGTVQVGMVEVGMGMVEVGMGMVEVGMGMVEVGMGMVEVMRGMVEVGMGMVEVGMGMVYMGMIEVLSSEEGSRVEWTNSTLETDREIGMVLPASNPNLLPRWLLTSTNTHLRVLDASDQGQTQSKVLTEESSNLLYVCHMTHSQPVLIPRCMMLPRTLWMKRAESIQLQVYRLQKIRT